MNDEDESPLGLFARSGFMPGLKYLLELENTEVNQKDTYGSTPLHLAATFGHTEIVKVLLSAEGILVNEKNNHGLTPLHRAGRYGQTEVVKVLLNHDRTRGKGQIKSREESLLLAI